jgi:transcriptional regulator with XRE-family HTH domain
MTQEFSSAEWRRSTDSIIVARMPAPDPLSLDAIAERLRLTRNALGLSQADIGRLAGIGAQAWNNNERARDRISLDQALKLCTATGVSLDWIYRGIMQGLPHDMAVKIQQLAREPAPASRRRA